MSMTAARLQIAIGPVFDPAVHVNLAAFEAVADGQWKRIEKATAVPKFGESYQVIRAQTYDDDVEDVAKGSMSTGSMTLVYNWVTEAPGQGAVQAATDDSINPYLFRISYNDKPPGAASKPTRHYFAALVVSKPIDPGNPNAFITRDAQLELVTRTYEAAKVAAA